MEHFIKRLYQDTKLGHLFIFPFKKLYDIYGSRILPEKMYIKQTFKNTFGYKLNLRNPKTIEEKINWLQLNVRTPLHTLCTDKYAVRVYVKKKIGEKYLIPLIFHTDNPAEIIPDNLPDYPFIIKTNHGCGRHVIVKDKTKVEWKRVRKDLKKLLKHNYYYKNREWQYKDIKPCIIVEKLLLDENSNIPYEYKFDCYNGHVKSIEVIMDRYADIKISIFESDWKLINYQLYIYKSGGDIKKPVKLAEMKLLAETLAKDFKFVRVDLYNIGSKIYFGEMTISPMAGFEKFPSPDLARKLGIELKL